MFTKLQLSKTFKLTISTVVLALTTLSQPASAFGPQSSAKSGQWNFDFVEEFDGLADWRRPGGVEYNVWSTSNMPKLANGNASAWGYYSLWSAVPPTQNWIGGGSTRPVWRGTKSLSMDLGDTAKGPSRFGLYFGQGYDDVRIFHMAYIPKNHFPTSCIGGSCSGNGYVGVYNAGQPYAYYAAYKFGTLSTGCLSARCPVSDTYGEYHLIPMITQHNYNGAGLKVQMFGRGNQYSVAQDGNPRINDLLGNWMGFEYRFRSINSGTQTAVDIWVYDSTGKSEHVMRGTTFNVTKGEEGKKFDQWFFGGNNSNSWTWGPTMTSVYYVDDFIVDAGSKGQIGPRYFSAIGTQTISPPSPPGGTGGVQVPAQ